MIGMILVAAIGCILAGSAIHEQSLGRIYEDTARNAEKLNGWINEQIAYTGAIANGFTAFHDVRAETIFPILYQHAESSADYFAVYAGYPDGSGVFSDEWVPDDGWQANERDWYKGAVASPGKIYISELYQDASTENFCLTLSQVFYHNGSIAGVVAIDIIATVLQDVVEGVDVGEGSYAFLADADGGILVHQNSDYAPSVNQDGDTTFQYLSTLGDGRYSVLSGNAVMGGEAISIRGPDGIARYYTASLIPSVGWILYTAIHEGVVNAPIYQQIWAAVLVSVPALLIAAALIYFSLRRMIVRPVKDVTKAANLLARGETGTRLDGNYIGEIAMLADSFRAMETFNRQQTEWLESIAAGDLSIEIQPRGAGDRTGHAIADMLRNLNDMFARINETAHQVASGSKQIADGSQLLAQGSTEQAASIEQLSSSVSEITRKTNENEDMAGRAAVLADTIKGSAEKSSRQMDEMTAAVKEINQASQNIQKVIKVIDDIAFQTNILALNAAVEAARAGQHGKGFAVVAEEVRSLAAKSADAAKDTGGLIAASMEKAELGSRIAEETAASLAEIVSGINESGKIIHEIARSSEVQSASIKQINVGIDQVAQVVQQNSATAEESAAASEEMNSQSGILNEQVERFRLADSGSAPKKLTDRY
jgi:methyl-accepting chemotaxis protein